MRALVQRAQKVARPFAVVLPILLLAFGAGTGALCTESEVSAKRSCGPVRGKGVAAIRTPDAGALGTAVTGGALSGVLSWRAATMVVAILAVSGAVRILLEWQRRRTFVALMADAPPGTVIVQSDRPKEQTMRITLGGRPRRSRVRGTG